MGYTPGGKPFRLLFRIHGFQTYQLFNVAYFPSFKFQDLDYTVSVTRNIAEPLRTNPFGFAISECFLLNHGVFILPIIAVRCILEYTCGVESVVVDILFSKISIYNLHR